MRPMPKNNTAQHKNGRSEPEQARPVSLPHRQYGNISVRGTGLTIVGDVYNNGNLCEQHTEPDEIGKFGLCLGSAPQLDSTYFVSREAEIDQIAHTLRPGTVPTKQQRLVLGGIGGVGKTQLAIAYAERHRCSYDSVFWLNAASPLALHTSLRLVAGQLIRARDLERLDDQQVLARVHEWLSYRSNTRWLLILDNYDEPRQYDIRDYCPYAAHGSIIVITRLPNHVRLSSDQLRVQPLGTIEEGLDLLQKRSQRENVQNSEDAYRLVKRLAGLPLALATAGAFLCQNPSMTFQQYLSAYEERWNIDPRRPLHLQEYQDRTIHTTWDLSYAQLDRDDPDAVQLLKLLAYFDNQQIWYELIAAGGTKKSSRLRNALRRAFKPRESPERLQRLLRDQVSFESAMRTLVQYCFVDAQSTLQSYSIHNCVHDWALARLNKTLDKQFYWHAFDCVAASIDHGDLQTLNYIKYNRLSLHATRLVHLWFCRDQLFYATRADQVENMFYIAELLAQQELYDTAEQMYLVASAQSQRILGLNHSTTLEVLSNLAYVYFRQSRFNEAEQMYKRVICEDEKILGSDHPSVLCNIHNLGLVYEQQGRLQEAEQSLKRALTGREKTLGSDHPSTLNSIHGLGYLYCYQGKLDEAEQMIRRALIGREELLGPHHARTLNSKAGLASLCLGRSQLAQAEKMYLQLLTDYEQVVGSEHTFYMLMLDCLGKVYEKQGRLKEAEAMYRRALAGFQRKLGLEHAETRRVMDSLAQLYRQQGKTEEADLLYQHHLV